MMLLNQLIMLFYQVNYTPPTNGTNLSNSSIPVEKGPQILLVNSTYFMKITSLAYEPLLLETKAYCAAFGHFPKQFEEKTAGNKTIKEAEHPSVVNSTQTGDKNETKLDEKKSRAFNWKEDKFNISHTARINVTTFNGSKKYGQRRYVHNMNARNYYSTQLRKEFPPLYTKTLIEEHLQKRAQELKNETHEVKISALENLFFNQTLTDQLFTNEIDQRIRELNPSLETKDVLRGSQFEIVGCEEMPTPGLTTVVLVLNGTIPVIPKELVDNYLNEVQLMK